MTTCPKCDEEISGELVAQLAEKSTVVFRITPKDGQLIAAKTVGGTLNALVDLLAACGKEIGVSTMTMVKSMTTDDSGAVEITLLALRMADGLKKTAPTGTNGAGD